MHNTAYKYRIPPALAHTQQVSAKKVKARVTSEDSSAAVACACRLLQQEREGKKNNISILLKRNYCLAFDNESDSCGIVMIAWILAMKVMRRME